MFKKILLSGLMLLSIPWLAAQNVGIGTATPAAKLDVQGNKIGYDVLKVSNDKDGIPDSTMVFSSKGHVGIGVPTPPNEILHLGGAMILGQSSAPVPLPGTIHYNPSAGGFFGYDGSMWNALDVVQDMDWNTQGNPFGFIELCPSSPPASVSMGFPGSPNQGGIIWIPDLTWPGQIPHQLMLESTTNATTDASMLFRMSDWTTIPPTLVDEYSQGIFAGDLSFKIYRGPVLGPTFQSDLFTMFRANPSGIIDLPNQSRVRAFQEDATGLYQLIPSGLWTPVNFTIDLQPPFGYDEHSEFTVAPSINAGVTPEQAYFTAAEAGYYQVNARCEFNVDEYYEDDLGGWMPVQVNPDSYVSIAIYTGPMPGQTSVYAQGNNLQIAYAYMMEHVTLVHIPDPLPGEPEYQLEYWTEFIMEKLRNNNAPNVSDVVYLQAGEIISIWVFHTAATPMNLNYVDPMGPITGKSKIYVSIHKVS